MGLPILYINGGNIVIYLSGTLPGVKNKEIITTGPNVAVTSRDIDAEAPSS